MKQKLDEIKDLYYQLNGFRLHDRCYYDFRRNVENMLKLIKELYEEETYESIRINLLQASSRLSHTLGKEITWISSYQDKIHKKNAAKLRRKEYEKSIEDAIRQVCIDLSPAIIV